MRISSTNPAIPFLQCGHGGTAEQLVRHYALYLLRTANAFHLPVDPRTVQRYFGLPEPTEALLPGQRGFLEGDELRIYLNADDPPTMRRFTFAHELMEKLFWALKEDEADTWVRGDALYETLMTQKERLCDIGAAELLMPLPLFQDMVPRPLYLAWAWYLASELGLSLTSVVWRIFEATSTEGALVIWRYGYSPREEAQCAIPQLTLFDNLGESGPPKKMRVVWSLASPSIDGFIPKHKSAPGESSIYQAYEEDMPTSGFDELDLRALRGRYFVESFPFNVRRERHVMSLIHQHDPNECESERNAGDYP